VAIGAFAILLRGPSGAGKSDLALRLIDQGAALVADDQVELVRHGDTLVARAPAALAGLFEVRGLGILPLPHRAEARVALACDLVRPDQVERMPEPMTATLLDLAIPLVRLDPFAASAPAKLRLAVRVATGSILPAR
jgi:serine kinase of HPr protein (carbohydrate metabolism regulator)